ncbi:hypothetical protein [Sheuella amnicola]|nr:hypothetical protein [Sheuella amnicola]
MQRVFDFVIDFSRQHRCCQVLLIAKQVMDITFQRAIGIQNQ